MVAALEEQFRKARLANETEALTGILSDDFIETNQNGDRRGKAELVVLLPKRAVLTVEHL